MMYFRRLSAAAVFASLLFAACGSSPKSLPCTTSDECTSADTKYQYCLEGRCVECVSSAGCGDGICHAGRCARRCVGGTGCAADETCTNEICLPT